MAGSKGGRPSFTPTDADREEVQRLRSCGFTEPQIAAVLRVDPKTLRKHCREELDAGGLVVKTKVASVIIQKALEGNLTAAIFFAKTQMGWSERIEHTGAKNGPPIRTRDESHALLKGKLDEIAVKLAQSVVPRGDPGAGATGGA